MAATKRGLVNIRRAMTSTPDYLDSITVNNYWDPLRTPGSPISLSNSNRTIARASGSGITGALAKSIAPLDRKSVIEFRLDSQPVGALVGFTIADPATLTSFMTSFQGYNANQGALPLSRGSNSVYKGTGVSSPVNTISMLEADTMPNDVLAFGYDPINGTIKAWKNGFPIYGGAPLFTGLIDKKLTYVGSATQLPDAFTMNSGATLKYRYPDYSLNTEGTVVPGKGLRKFDLTRKPPSALTTLNDYSIYLPALIAGHVTGYITEPLPNNKKTVIEFIACSSGYASSAGLIFNDADKTGPKDGYLGSITNSLGMHIGGGQRGWTFGNGCTTVYGTINNSVDYGDVMAFGYDPVARTVKMWKNGVALRGGLPIWTNLPVAEVSAAYSLRDGLSRVRVNSDALRYNYGDYTE